MTPEEYIQLKAFARLDGALLCLLWLMAFACYIIGLSNPSVELVAVLLMLFSPFFAARRTGRFRDDALNGTISFMRAWAYNILMFFYSGILTAIVVYVYFAFIDQGFVVQSLRELLGSAESVAAMEQMGMRAQFEESLAMMAGMRPIDFSLNMLSAFIMLGIMLGMPIALLMRRKEKAKNNQQA